MFKIKSKVINAFSLFILFTILFSNQITSQTNPDLNFFPLHIGDTWQYFVEQKSNSQGGIDTSYYYTIEIVGKDVIDGKEYFIYSLPYTGGVASIRIDSSDATIWGNTIEECMLDSLSMEVGDTISNECYGTIVCTKDTSMNIFNMELRTKIFDYNPAMTLSMHREYKYAFGIGRVSSITSVPEGDFIETLVYAKIDGIEHGILHQGSVNDAVEYFPLNIGDVRIYEIRYNDNTAYDSLYYETVSVIGTEIYNGKKFYKIESSIEGITYLRVDSLDATVWEYKNGYECMIDSLSVLTDTIVINGCNPIRFFENKVDTIFNTETEVRTFGYAYVISSGTTFHYSYAKGFGLVSHSKSLINVWATTTNKNLIYAEIDGVIYGKKVQNYLDYYPIAVGNKWIYDYSSYSSYDGYPSFTKYTYSVEITKDTTLINGKHYFYLEDRSWGRWIRVDTLENKIYEIENFEDESECLIVDLGANSVDEYDICNGYVSSVVNKDTLLWNENRGSKIYHLYTLSAFEETYVEGIGLILEKFSFDFGDGTRSLKGCIIDGSVYGDTLVTVEQIGENIPTEFTLFQNYPNPFNPSTTIKYSIPNLVDANYASITNVILKVYDILGREVATLVNKKQRAGNYEVSFDASKLPTGTYIYKIEAGSFFNAKKMILIK